MLPFPCDASQCVLYATWLARKFKYRLILNYLSALNNFLKEHNSPFLDYKDYILSSTLKGICHVKGDVLKQALPMLPCMLLSVFSLLTLNPGHLSWWAAMLCCFRGLLRKCHVTLSDSSLQRKDFRFYTWGMVIKVYKTKTIQFSERYLQIPIVRCQDTRLCAIHWTELHFKQMPAEDAAMAFRIPSQGGSAPLT